MSDTSCAKKILLPSLPSAAPLSEAVLFGLDDHAFPFHNDELFDKAVPAGNPILGVGDNIVADASLERAARISERARA